MLLREPGKARHLACSVPKSLLFNLRHFSFAQAIRLRLLVSHRVKLMKLGGAPGVWCGEETARIRFGDNGHLGFGVRVHCSGGRKPGADINSNANTAVLCAKGIRIGRGRLLAWDVALMDRDYRAIVQDGMPVNAPADIEIGESVWLARVQWCMAILPRRTASWRGIPRGLSAGVLRGRSSRATGASVVQPLKCQNNQ